MAIGAVIGRTATFLAKNFTRFGRLNPWLGVGLAGVTVGSVIYKNRQEEKRIEQIVQETFRDEIRERDLWERVRSRAAGASEDLYKTFQVYGKGEAKPTLKRAHSCKPGEGEIVEPVDEPDTAQACDLVRGALEDLLQSGVNDLALFKEKGPDHIKALTTGLKRLQARLEKARDGKVKRPDYPGMQAQLDGFVETDIKPVLSELSYVIEQGTIRIRDEFRRGEHK